MGLWKLLPASLRLKLILSAIIEVRKVAEARHLGQLLNEQMDAQLGKELSDPAQIELAAYLETVARELRN